MKLRLFELVSTDTWWVASVDDTGVLSILRDEMESRDFSDVDIDFMLNDFELNELSKHEAEIIGLESESGDVKSLWTQFVQDRREGVIGTTLDVNVVDMDDVPELNFDTEY